MGDINANAENALSGIRVTKAYANEALELEKFNGSNEGSLESRKAVYRNESYFSQSVTAITELFTVAVVVLGGMSMPIRTRCSSSMLMCSRNFIWMIQA